MSQFIPVTIAALWPSPNAEENWDPQWRKGAVAASDIVYMKTFHRGVIATEIKLKHETVAHSTSIYVKETVDEILGKMVPDKEFGLSGAL